MTTKAVEAEPQFPAIRAAWGSSQAGSTRGMLLVRDELGHSTRHVDYADMDAWMSEHHPEVFVTADGGKRTLELDLVTPAILGAYFADEAHRNPPRWAGAVELGHLVDSTHPFMNYASRLADWKPAVCVEGADGRITILTAEAFEKRGGALGGKVIDPHTDPRFVHGVYRRNRPTES